jgi:bifunctional enzyme CysN/CysC
MIERKKDEHRRLRPGAVPVVGAPVTRPGGATVWITGLSGAGKSTLALAVAAELDKGGARSCILDGDDLRAGLNRDLGFSPAERGENVRRIAEVARLFCQQGFVAIVAAISPYSSGRQLARRTHADAGYRFIEVYMNTPAELCERRDAKGLYARSRAGDLVGLSGLDAPYEPPRDADLVLSGDDDHPPVDSARAVVSYLLGLEPETASP